MEKPQSEEPAAKEAVESKPSEDPKSPELVASDEKPTVDKDDPPKQEGEEEKSDKERASEEATESAEKAEERKQLVGEDSGKSDKKKGDEVQESERKTKEDPDLDETVEEFEDAVDTVGEPDDIELPDHFRSDRSGDDGSSTRSSRHSSRRGSVVSSDENLPRLRVTESETYEIESSPEKSPPKQAADRGQSSRRRSTSEEPSKPRPGPSRVRSQEEDIETVDLDDDEDDYDEDRSFEEDEDDYYDEDPESDDQEVNRVIQEAVDEIDAMDDNPESGEEDKMDVSSDEDDYSDDDDVRQRSIVVSKRGTSDKRKRGSDYSEGEIYDDDDDYDQVGEVDEPEGGFRPPSSATKSREVSLGRISLDDSDDEERQQQDDAVSSKKKVGGKVKYKSYNQKLVAGIRKRTFKILNKRRSMHVMDEGSDAVVCSSDATTTAKVVSLSTSTSSSKSPAAPEEARKPELESSPKEAAEVLEDKQRQVVGDENKENMTVKDVNATVVAEEEVKAVKDDGKGKKKKEEEQDVMSGMMDDLDGDCTYRNGSKTEDFNDELTFQMDVDGGKDGGSQRSEDSEEEDRQDEQGAAVDLSSPTEAVSKQQQQQSVELVESSPEKEVRQENVPDLSVEKVVKVEPEEEQVPEQRRVEKEVDLSSKTSPKEKPQPEKPVSRKRRRSVEEYEDEEDAEPLVPSKKLKRELECNFRAHDRLLKEYIETTSNDSMEDVQKNTELLMVEIQALNDMIRAKENEWNNMIHLKKVKEEILMRLTRKKNVLNLTHTKLGEEPPAADYSLSNVRSASVGPRPPTPPPEVDIRPASVTPLHNSRQSANTSSVSDNSRRQTSNSTSNLFAQFNHINSSVTMVPLSTSPSLITSTNTILQSRANMKPADLAKEKPNAAQIQRQILPKPILSNHQQILSNLAMSAGLTAATSSTNPSPNTSTNSITAAAALAANNILTNLGLSAQAAALLNGHHNPQQQQHQSNQLQVGRQGVIKDVKSIIADYRQKHPEQVPRRGRRLKNIPSSAYDAMKGSSSTDQRMRELSFLLAAAENTSRPSSNDSSQSNSNAPPPQPAPLPPGAVSFKDVLVQFAKMSQSDRTLLSSLSSLSNAVTAAAVTAASSGTTVVTTNCSSSSPQQQQRSGAGESAVSSLGKGGAYPEVTLHPVMNSNSVAGGAGELNLSNGQSNASQQSANNSSSSNSLLHGILTKSASRPNPTPGATTAAANSGPGFTSFSPTLARLLTAPERMNSAAAAAAQQQAATVTSGALANLQATTGLNLSKSNSEITITPVGGASGGAGSSNSSIQQSLLQAAAAHQQLQEQQKQLQRLREQHFMNMDDEAEDSVDRLVIDEGDDGHHDSGHQVNHHGSGHGHQRSSASREPSVVITTRGHGSGGNNEFHENDVPECQGCKKREAQFVCAGCGNQWYCSRECQVNAWDDHSEVCTG